MFYFSFNDFEIYISQLSTLSLSEDLPSVWDSSSTVVCLSTLVILAPIQCVYGVGLHLLETFCHCTRYTQIIFIDFRLDWHIKSIDDRKHMFCFAHPLRIKLFTFSLKGLLTSNYWSIDVKFPE